VRTWVTLDSNASGVNDTLTAAAFVAPLRAAITVTMALETNVGATSRKATLRAAGTAAGGVLGAVCVSLTTAVNGGWAPGAPPGKVAAMTALISATGGFVQLMRARDPAHDYACAPANAPAPHFSVQPHTCLFKPRAVVRCNAAR
jgi:hypothetical protein